MFCPSVRYERNLSFLRKMSLFTALKRRRGKGSITVETAAVLPLFLFFLLAFFAFFQALHVQEHFADRLTDTARTMAAKCYAAEEDTEALGALYVQGQLQTDCTESYLKQMGVEAGRAGIRTGKSLLRAGDEWLKLRADVRLRNLYPVPISKTIETHSIAFARAWTGYDGSGFGGGSGEKSGFVYWTVNGSVIHTDPECSYLNPSVTPTDRTALETRRNLDGEKYRPCELCCSGSPAQVYITESGNRYHASLGCSGLKRTVLAIPREEAEGCPVCQKCAGKK